MRVPLVCRVCGIEFTAPRFDASKAARRQLVLAKAAVRAERRKLRERKAEQDRERLLDQIVGAAVRKVEQEQALTATIRTVAAFLKLFVKQRRNDFSAEAITAAIDDADHYPLELVTEALAKLKADGDYDRILAEPVDADA
jgi:hypothetical protein